MTPKKETHLYNYVDAIKEAYFHWLVAQVRESQERGEHRLRTYWDLLRLMNQKEFIWIVPNDDNRIGDAMELRGEFLRTNEIRDMTVSDFGLCSVLEVLIALSRRIEFQSFSDATAEEWAWQLLDNLRLSRMSDPLSPRRAKRVDSVLERLVWRTYDPGGNGGFFPLNWPQLNQTRIEIWAQMHAYLAENEYHTKHYLERGG